MYETQNISYYMLGTLGGTIDGMPDDMFEDMKLVI